MIGERKRTFRRLDEAYANSLHVPFDIKRDRYVIFSDLHLADRKRGIDDFARNEMIYCHALQHYYDTGFHLILNGDVEESWEARPRKIRSAYRDTVYEVERKFALKGEPWHIRTWGNHDDIWANSEKVRKHLWPELGPVTVYPGVRLGDNLFVAHGHQGELLGDSGAWISEPAIRFFWRWLQRLTRWTSARAATNHLIRTRRAESLYQWARNRGQLFIAGHTHKSMFGYLPEQNELINHMRRLEATLASNPNPYEARATIEHLHKTISRGKRCRRSGEGRLPCYFNSGSCVHTNGITGIEIDRGGIRLVRWSLVETASRSGALVDEDGLMFTIRPRILQRANLAEVVAQIKLAAGRSSLPLALPAAGHAMEPALEFEEDEDVHAAA
ncbi:MAG: hypothetical protein MAG453_01382 [Calditrichaeota bacterium]|nr:hypothetical protein [Calditrichota bacterium]